MTNDTNVNKVMGDFIFNTRKNDFNITNALGCARISLLAYDEAPVAQQTATALGFDRFECFTRHQHFGIMLGNTQTVFIAFRGTNERADWKTNLNIFFKRSPLGWVHRGFMKATELFWPELHQRLLEFRDRNQPIWITGHSLGGALALLAAVKFLVEHKLEIAGIYTFGQLPIGRSGFCERFKDKFPNRVFRFVNHIDAVSDSEFLREHVGEVRYFDTDGTLWEGEPPWRVSLLDHIRASSRFGGFAMFAAHSMKNYVELLEKQFLKKPHIE